MATALNVLGCVLVHVGIVSDNIDISSERMNSEARRAHNVCLSK